jgi:hypothetical protein
MTGNQNSGRYRRRLPDPELWPSNTGSFCPDAAVEATRVRVNELSWELAGEQLAEEIEGVLAGRRMRRGDPGE